jgi:ABC-type dipeptide/oligopeptide/nickel transport system ATPase subunit
MIPKSIQVTLQSPVSNSFRCKMAANSLDIDTSKKSVHHLSIDNIHIPEGWNIGVIYGASGSGKTTLAKKLFGESIFKSALKEDLPIIEQFDDSYNYQDCADMLNGMGLNSVPCWIRPVYTLSNGQKARAEAALLLSLSHLVVIDEWTSVVDRAVGKAMSVCVSRYVKKRNKKIILLTCHLDIIEWLKADWVIDCNKQEFLLPRNDGFFLPQRKTSNSQSGLSTKEHGNILASITI